MSYTVFINPNILYYTNIIHLPSCIRYMIVQTTIKKRSVDGVQCSKEVLNSAVTEVIAGRTPMYGTSKQYKIPYLILLEASKERKKERTTTDNPNTKKFKLANGLKTLEK